jgi:hypothetical protein
MNKALNINILCIREIIILKNKILHGSLIQLK